MRIAFVTTWYGKNIGGGAEAECRGLVHALKRRGANLEIEVLTTCLKEFAADWNVNAYDPGVYLDEGITVRRFDAEAKNRDQFHPLNYFRLMPPVLHDLHTSSGTISPLTPKEEEFYIQNMVVSRDLLSYISTHRAAYDLFVFIPYMFATTVLGALKAKDNYVVIPCLHKERYAYMRLYQKLLNKAAGVFFHVPAEKRFANEIYDIPPERQFLIGEKVDTSVLSGDAERFRKKYDIQGPYFLYAGRKIEGKNLPELVGLFRGFRNDSLNVKLVVIGSGDLDYRGLESSDCIHDLGFVSSQDKFDAMAGARALLQPSLNESFSIVMMEAWLQSTPVIVDARCEVTREHCEISMGGLYYSNAEEFSKSIRSFLDDDLRRSCGELGRKYVLNNFSEPIVVERVLDAFRRICGKATDISSAFP